MLKDAEGNRLFRKIEVRVVFPEAIFPPKIFSQHAPPHQGFGSTGVDDFLEKLADRLEELYPFWDFKSVELTPVGRTARYTFKFAGYRKSEPQQANMEDFTLHSENKERARNSDPRRQSYRRQKSETQLTYCRLGNE